MIFSKSILAKTRSFLSLQSVICWQYWRTNRKQSVLYLRVVDAQYRNVRVFVVRQRGRDKIGGNHVKIWCQHYFSDHSCIFCDHPNNRYSYIYEKYAIPSWRLWIHTIDRHTFCDEQEDHRPAYFARCVFAE